MKDLDDVLKSLKSNKARDPEGIDRTIFKTEIIGSNLKESLLELFNKIKNKQEIPQFMRKATVTTIPKKGSKLLLKNERGIFIVNSIRNILMRLIFNLKNKMIDNNMSDSNVGGRKHKSGINQIWTINRIIHDQLSSVKRKPVVIQQYDFKQMFDGMDSGEACGDIFNYGVNDDHLKLLYEANKRVVINVKTPQGQSDDYVLTDRVMQGDTWASALASAQVDSFGKEMLIEEPSFMYKFQGEVSIPLLGQVDDLIGVAEAGFKSNQLNSYINVKTADKDLQFGVEKCKVMVVSKMKPYLFQRPDLTVDTWKINHKPDGEIEEEFEGKVPINEEDALMYLGFMLSKKGDNFPNIIHKRNRSTGTQKNIIKLIEPLGIYTFECALIYVKSLIRNSILYAAEAMYSVNESQYRALEAIEESVLLKVFKTLKSCPRYLIYLESGLIPARYQVHRQVLNFLHYILQQPKNSLLYRILESMIKNPTKGDWASASTLLIEKYDLKLNLEDIQKMKSSIYKNLVKKQIRKIAFKDLVDKQQNKEKGKSIRYDSLKMADYLLPESNLNNKDKLEIFALRAEMNPNPYNFGLKTLCELGCQQFQDNKHLFYCEKVNKNENVLSFENILNGSLKEKVMVLRKFQENMNEREQLRDSANTVNPL